MVVFPFPVSPCPVLRLAEKVVFQEMESEAVCLHLRKEGQRVFPILKQVGEWGEKVSPSL